MFDHVNYNIIPTVSKLKEFLYSYKNYQCYHYSALAFHRKPNEVLERTDGTRLKYYSAQQVDKPF